MSPPSFLNFRPEVNKRVIFQYNAVFSRGAVASVRQGGQVPSLDFKPSYGPDISC